MASTQRICLFGGSFDPPHVAHLLLAETVCQEIEIGRIIFLPCGASALKQPPVASAAQRLEMLRLAISGNPAFAIDERETRRAGPSYTIDTVREFRAENAGAEILFVMGADQLKELHRWREPEGLAQEARIIATLRPPLDDSVFQSLGAHFAPDVVERIWHDAVHMPQLDVSSTDIRARVGAEKSVRYLVPETVREFITREGLYRPREK